ncbi:SDR family NAD(P)-dependent oxidoreductase [Streptomyces sp. NPDC101776]|uniref:SDR family NAD(P)-dependent oxidoreductase n=1 Tax=Streptomyces sp. NPDC101776 TaxID=3366146 RepID=UPI00382C4773
MLDLAGRHVLVLGGGQGIGRQTCLAAAVVGARVSVVDPDAVRAKAVAEEIDGLAVTGDATNRAEVERVIEEAVERFGPVHELADIIGISDWGPLSEITDELWDRGLDLNLRHALLALQIGARAMTEGGSMVFVGSISGLRSSPNHAVYGATKAGLGNRVATAALELGPDTGADDRHAEAFEDGRLGVRPLRQSGVVVERGEVASVGPTPVGEFFVAERLVHTARFGVGRLDLGEVGGLAGEELRRPGPEGRHGFVGHDGLHERAAVHRDGFQR